MTSVKKINTGMGINDADYFTNRIVNGRTVMCPFYRRWSGMINRCYSKKTLKRQTTYQGCSVCNEWLTFSNFKKWMETQNWEGRELDKDLLVEGNKVYSPETCVFVETITNTILNNCESSRGDLPVGVSRQGKIYQSQCANKGKQIYLGVHKTPEIAHEVYLNYKAMIIIDHAEEIDDIRICASLLRAAERMSRKSEEISILRMNNLTP